MSRGTLIILSLILFAGGCGPSNNGDTPKASPSSLKAEPSSIALAKVFDPKVIGGPSLGIDDEISVSELRGCDQFPANTAEAGNALLQKRRQIKNSAYVNARNQYIVSDTATPDDLTKLTNAIRLRYEQEVLPQIPVHPLLGIDSEPFTMRYFPQFSEIDGDPVTVHGRRLSLRVAGTGAAEERVVAYFLNYDRVEPSRPSVVLVLAGGVNHNPTKFELDPQANYAATIAGRLAAMGWPVLVVDDAFPTILRSLAAIRAIDRSLLKTFARVHVIGAPDLLFHFLMFHESQVASAYVVGGALPLWTRNDSFFPKDPKTENTVVQDKFQWADFGLAVLDQGITLAMVSDVGQSGPGKAALFIETLPVLKKHPAAAERFLRIVGNDRNGDGKGDHNEVCHDGDTADYRGFFKEMLSRP